MVHLLTSSVLAMTMVAADAPAPSTSAALAGAQLAANSSKVIEVSAEPFASNAAIPNKFSAYHDGVSPGVIWSPVGDAKSYVLIVEDPDAPTPRPVVHWVVFNIPAGTTKLAADQPKAGQLVEPKGALQGKSSHDNLGYFGPRPPKGDNPHHYHFQVFALDAPLNLSSGASRDDVVGAAQGHIMAKGELVGIYAEPKS